MKGGRGQTPYNLLKLPWLRMVETLMGGRNVYSTWVLLHLSPQKWATCIILLSKRLPNMNIATAIKKSGSQLCFPQRWTVASHHRCCQHTATVATCRSRWSLEFVHNTCGLGAFRCITSCGLSSRCDGGTDNGQTDRRTSATNVHLAFKAGQL